MTNISAEVVLGMPFHTFSNGNIQFIEKELTWRSYTTAEPLLNTKRLELINKKEYAKAALDEKSETFVIWVASLNLILGIHSDRAAWIASLLTKEVRISGKYLHFVDVISEKKALVLPEQTEFNQHAIKLEKGKQLTYRPIYSLGPVELETLKIYIETHLKTGFIRPFKSPLDARILFNKKLNGSFHLCVDYWGFNNLTIKNQYPLLLSVESPDRLEWAKRFTQLDITSI